MDMCPLPVEICEQVIVDVAVLPDFTVSANPHDEDSFHNASAALSSRREALYSCALTCRAWSLRARYLLNHHILLVHNSLGRYIHAVRTERDRAEALTSLYVAGDGENVTGSDLAPLFMDNFPQLRRLFLRFVDISGTRRPESGGPGSRRHTLYPRLLRMRLPLFSNLQELVLYHCYFESVRQVFDLVWGCPNLSVLVVFQCGMPARIIPFPAGYLDRLRPFKKLTQLGFIAWAGKTGITHLCARLFGEAVTVLKITYLWEPLSQGRDRAVKFLSGGFPALRELILFFDTRGDTADDPIDCEPPLVDALARALIEPHSLQTLRITLVVDGDIPGHAGRTLPTALFGRGELGDAPLRSVLVGLKQLEVVFARRLAGSGMREGMEAVEATGPREDIVDLIGPCTTYFRSLYPSMEDAALTVREIWDPLERLDLAPYPQNS